MGSWFQVRGLYTANLRWLVDVRVYGTSKAQYRTYTTFADYVSIVTPPPIGERSIVMSVSVCLSVCLSVCVCGFVCPRLSTELRVPSPPNFLCMLPMTVAQSSIGGVVVNYVFPVYG